MARNAGSSYRPDQVEIVAPTDGAAVARPDPTKFYSLVDVVLDYLRRQESLPANVVPVAAPCADPHSHCPLWLRARTAAL